MNSMLVAINSTFINNTSPYASTIIVKDAWLNVKKSLFLNNTSTVDKSLIVSTGNSMLNLTECTFIANYGKDVSILYAAGTQDMRAIDYIQFTGCLFENNTSHSNLMLLST